MKNKRTLTKTLIYESLQLTVAEIQGCFGLMQLDLLI